MLSFSVNCDCYQDTTSDNEKELGSSESRLLASLRSTSNSSLLESNEAVPAADSSTVSTDVDPTPALPPTTSQDQVSRPTASNRLLLQLLAGESSADADGFSGTETGSCGTSVPTSQSLFTMLQTSASNELSEDLSSVNVTDLFNANNELAGNQNAVTVGKLDVEDQLLMAQLEQAIMNSELSLEDLDHLLAVGSSVDTAPLTVSSASTSAADIVIGQQHHQTLLGNLPSRFWCCLRPNAHTHCRRDSTCSVFNCLTISIVNKKYVLWNAVSVLLPC